MAKEAGQLSRPHCPQLQTTLRPARTATRPSEAAGNENEAPMPVNSGLAQVSNELLLGTVILYAIAMLCYACDFAFGKQRMLAVAPVPELVGAAAPAGTGVGGAGSAAPDRRNAAGSAAAGSASSRWPAGFWLRLAFGFTCVGVTGQVLAILARGLAEHRTPWGNMYEFIEIGRAHV